MKSSGHIQLLARIYTNSVICMYSYKYCNFHNNVQAEKCQARNPWRVSVLLVQLRWMGAAGGWNDAVLAQVQEHLPVGIGGVPNNHGGQAQARGRAGLRALRWGRQGSW